MRHQKYRFLVLLCLLTAWTCLLSPVTAAQKNTSSVSQSPAVSTSPVTKADLEKIIARLNDPVLRLQAISELFRFTGMHEWLNFDIKPFYSEQGSSSPLEALKQMAAKAIDRYSTPEMTSVALESNDPILRHWALSNFETDLRHQQRWVHLLSKVERLAEKGDFNERYMADHILMGYEKERDFCNRRFIIETDPNLLEVLINFWEDGASTKKISDRFLTLLDHKDEKVRIYCLGAIRDNENAARPRTYGKNLFDKIIERTLSSSSRERIFACYALEALKKMNTDRYRTVLLRMANDPSGEVRRVVPDGLREDAERPDVRPVLLKLLKDTDPATRYSAARAIGPMFCVKELRELALCPNKNVAEMAIGQLKLLGLE